MYSYSNNNKARLTGVISSEVFVSHEIKGVKFYKFLLSVSRKSGTDDVLPIIFSENNTTIDKESLRQGRDTVVLGTLRTHTCKDAAQNSHLCVYIYADDILVDCTDTCEDNNLVEFDGFLCKPPVLRKTPLGRHICDLLVACNRDYCKSSYIPCLAWGTSALMTADFDVSSQLSIKGRLQSRLYKKQVDGQLQNKTTYEVSISDVDLIN